MFLGETREPPVPPADVFHGFVIVVYISDRDVIESQNRKPPEDFDFWRGGNHLLSNICETKELLSSFRHQGTSETIQGDEVA